MREMSFRFVVEIVHDSESNNAHFSALRRKGESVNRVYHQFVPSLFSACMATKTC